MGAPPTRTWSIVAASTLALITLFVFYTLQDVGPESAIRRFHMAVLQGNRSEIDALASQGANAPTTQWLESKVVNAIAVLHARYQVMHMDRSDTSVGAEVAYVLPNGSTMPMYWIIEKDRGRHQWRVNADRTYEITVSTLRY